MELSTQVDARGGAYRLAGTYAPELRAVVGAFIENFKVEDEVGAACSVVLDGRTVVDIWGGWRDRAMRISWDAPTTVCMMSVAKGITAICFNMLIDRGLVDPNARVTEYWPEYGQAGKEKTLVRHFLDHTAAVPVLTTNPLWPGAMFDREAMIKALEQQEPLWDIGTKAAYHVHHQGFLLGEIMRRVTGMTVGPFLRKEVSTPLKAEYYIGGMTHEQQSFVAEVMPNMEAKLFAAKDGPDQTSLRALAFKQNPAEPWAVTMNRREWRTVEVASGSGHGNARGVARIYGALGNGGALDGVRILSPRSVALMTTNQSGTLHSQTGLGFGLGFETVDRYGASGMSSVGTFSWGGAYGSQYRVDPEARLTIVFMMQLIPSRTDVAQKFPNVVYQALTDAPRVGTSH